MTVHLGENLDTPQGLSSVTKLMTGLIVRELVPDLDVDVEINSGDVIGGSTAQLQAGDIATYRKLLYGAILPSGNDAAHALARLCTGNRNEFYAAMNAKAGNLGMTTATFAAAWTGGEASPRDTMTLMRAFGADPVLRAIGGTQSYEMAITGPNARAYTITHTASIDTFPDMICAKTGTGNNLYNLAMLWGYAGQERVSVVLSAPSAGTRNSKMTAMIAWEKQGIDIAAMGLPWPPRF